MKVVINRCFGGFSISKKAAQFMSERGNAQAQAEVNKLNLTDKFYGFGYSEELSGTLCSMMAWSPLKRNTSLGSNSLEA